MSSVNFDTAGDEQPFSRVHSSTDEEGPWLLEQMPASHLSWRVMGAGLRAQGLGSRAEGLGLRA